jgi:heptosyltransferase II
MPRTLVIMPNWIGDFALALSVVSRKAAIDGADSTLLVAPPLIPLCTLLCGFAVIPYKRKTKAEFRATLKAIKSGGFNTVYVLPPSFSSAWCAFRCTIPRRRGISRELRGRLLTDALPGSLRGTDQHLTYEYALVLETNYNPPEYWQGAAIDTPHRYADAIVLCPGSLYGPAKRWPWFKQLAQLLPGKKIVLLGGAGDKDTGESIEAPAAARIENLIGKTSLIDAAAIIAAARLVISNDSGLMHLAGFLGTPVVGIFGSTSPKWTRPLGKRVVCAKIKCDCSPCFKRTCTYGHYNCLKNLSADYVASAAENLLRGGRP